MTTREEALDLAARSLAIAVEEHNRPATAANAEPGGVAS